MKYDLITIDLAKNVFQFAGFVGRAPRTNRKVTRAKLVQMLAQSEPTTVAMEACATAHYWARRCEEFGHRPFLIPPQFVQPYRRGNKNDANDALAIAEAKGRPGLKPVAVKTVDQQVMQLWHRRRSLVVRQRTQTLNQARAFALELGLCIPRGRAQIMRAIPRWIEDAENELTVSAREWFIDLYDQLREMDVRIEQLDQRLRAWAKEDDACQSLQTLHGIGPVVATALVAAMGDGSAFRNGRAASAWIGLVPGHASSGEKHVDLGITKRGNPELRALLIHGARAAIRHLGDRDDAVSRWARELIARRGKHKAIVAYANKLARMAWAILQSGETNRYA